jgi:hypothetical protein
VRYGMATEVASRRITSPTSEPEPTVPVNLVG